MGMPTNKELIERAYGAWLKYRRSAGEAPTLSASQIREYDGRTYVILRRGEQVVDVYRYLDAEDQLRRIVRYYPWGRKRAAA